MDTAVFDYHLPNGRIAQQSVEPRDHARLLCIDRATAALEDRHVYDLPSLLQPGDLLIFNDSRVFKARFFATKSTGAKIELLFHKPIDSHHWEVMAKPAKRLHPGDTIVLDGGWNAKVEFKHPESGLVTLRLPETTEAFFLYSDLHGDVPTPPYVDASQETKASYQTVYAKTTGSVAAPTAGFHFTEELLQRLNGRGVQRAFVTLHVGIGTFRPMNDGSLEQHVMHEEWGHVPQSTADLIQQTKTRGGRVVAVGTTAVRALESAAQATKPLSDWSGWTHLFITPGYPFRVIDGLMTNFHLPKSTLIVLVSSFLGIEPTKQAYQHAIDHEYRFYSFGDAMLIL